MLNEGESNTPAAPAPSPALVSNHKKKGLMELGDRDGRVSDPATVVALPPKFELPHASPVRGACPLAVSCAARFFFNFPNVQQVAHQQT